MRLYLSIAFGLIAFAIILGANEATEVLAGLLLLLAALILQGREKHGEIETRKENE